MDRLNVVDEADRRGLRRSAPAATAASATGNDLLKSAPERAPWQSAARCAHPALQSLPCPRRCMPSIMPDMMLGIVMS